MTKWLLLQPLSIVPDLMLNISPRLSTLSRDSYSEWVEEGIIVNALGVTLVALGIVVSFAVRRSNAPATAKVYVTERL